MCLGIPGKVIEVFTENELTMGMVDYSGTVNKVCLEYVPEIKVGEYTVVHAGFAISIIDEEEAKKAYEAWSEVIDAAASEGLDAYGNELQEDNRGTS